MKKIYFFVCVLLTCSLSYGQFCSDADSDVNYAYSHTDSAYNANNITHLKEYAQRALEAFNRAKTKLQTCGCDTAYNNAYDGYEALKKVSDIESLEDGRFYTNKARDIAQEAIDNLETCTKSENQDLELAALEDEQYALKQQQLELKLKAERIKLKLAEREAEEVRLKKASLITRNENAISMSIETYNETLSSCGCNTRLSQGLSDSNALLEKSLASIKAYYIESFKNLAMSYVSKLEHCQSNTIARN